MTNQDAQQVARRVLEVLPDQGTWAKGATITWDDRHCLGGAIAVSCPKLNRDEYITVLTRIIEEQFPGRLPVPGTFTRGRYQVIIRFNDHDDTVFADIRTVAEKAAAHFGVL